MTIRCSEGAKLQASHSMKRKGRVFMMTKYPFIMTTGENKGVLELRAGNRDHNHGQIDATAHSTRRKRVMTKEKVSKIQNATRSSIELRQVRKKFEKENPSCILQLTVMYSKKTELFMTKSIVPPVLTPILTLLMIHASR